MRQNVIKTLGNMFTLLEYEDGLRILKKNTNVDFSFIILFCV